MGKQLKLSFIVLFIISLLIFGLFALKRVKITTKPVIQSPQKNNSETLKYTRRYDVYNKNDTRNLKKMIVTFSIEKNTNIIADAHYYTIPILDSIPPEVYSGYEISTTTSGCKFSTMGGPKIPKNENWELVFKQKFGEINYLMKRNNNEANISGTIIESSGLEIPISFGVSCEDSKLMESCITDSKSILTLLKYEIAHEE